MNDGLAYRLQLAWHNWRRRRIMARIERTDLKAMRLQVEAVRLRGLAFEAGEAFGTWMKRRQHGE